MLELLVVLTLVEVALALAVLVLYLVLVLRRLRATAALFGKIAFGVRAIDSQTASVGPMITEINEHLERIAAILPGVAQKAERQDLETVRGAADRRGPQGGA